jgi:hypothetical protein
MEGRFLDIGGQLGTAVDTIGTLTLTFDRLANELKGENLRGATQQLSRVMTAVATARVDDGKRTVFKQLADLITKIQERIAQMGKAVSDLGMLAMNTRIEAANIGDARRDFPIFTAEIARTLGLAHTSLDDLGKRTPRRRGPSTPCGHQGGRSHTASRGCDPFRSGQAGGRHRRDYRSRQARSCRCLRRGTAVSQSGAKHQRRRDGFTDWRHHPPTTRPY